MSALLRRRGIEAVEHVSASFPAPVAAYNFNAGSGTSAADSSGNSRTLTVNTGITGVWDSGGHTGYGLNSSNATTAGATSGCAYGTPWPANGTLEQWTVMMWVKLLAGTGSYQGLWAKYGDFDAFIDPTNAPGLDFFPGSQTAGPPLTIGAWTHLAWVGTDGLYTNGVFAGGAAAAYTPAAADVIQLGGSWDAAGFQGIIDDVRFFNQPLTAAQITAAMNTPV